jgi:hypothetical protein
MSAVESVIRKWKGDLLPLKPGASEAELAVLSDVLGIPLPEDVREFYATMNGMEDRVHDSHIVSFWSIDRIRSEAESGVRAPFADVLIDSWRFVFSRTATGLVVLSENVAPEASEEHLGTFSDFLWAYVRTPNKIGIVTHV